MPIPSIVISHPPHGAVDAKQGALVLGLAPVDVRLKANHAVPEIWLALDDAPNAAAAADRLRRAEFRVVARPGTALAALSEIRPVTGFSFGATALSLQGERAEASLPYDSALVAVLFTPRLDAGKASQVPSFLDLYLPAAGAPTRWTVLQGVTGFAGMGARQTASFGTNLHAFAADVEARFPRAVLDRRLEQMRVRRRFGVPPPGTIRQGYSFATSALNRLLESIRPGLSELEDPDLTSRLAYLTHAGP
jgi:hypothetical protein